MAKANRLVPDEAALLAEALRINYRLRSTFFYRKLKEYDTLSLPALVSQLLAVAHLYNWDDRKAWGVGEDAFHYVASHANLHLLQVFCHPKLLREQPRLIAYYRNIAALSQKSVGYLAGVSVQRFEADPQNTLLLSDAPAHKLAKLFNEHVTLIVEASLQSLSPQELHGLLLTSTGAQIDGSWRNAIGEEAEKLVQRLVIRQALTRGWVAAFLPRAPIAPQPVDPTHLDEQLSRLHQYRGVLLTNQKSLLFASEPDISLLDQSGATAFAIEVKGGADPAGALERYGAAKKSFEESRRLTPNIPTILVASCITPEVHARIENDPTISAYYNLTALLDEDSATHAAFISQVFGIIAA